MKVLKLKKLLVGLTTVLVMSMISAPTMYGQKSAADGKNSETALFLKKKGKKYGFTNVEGKIVIPCKYHYAKDFSEGLALVGIDKVGYGFINKEGVEVIPCQYNDANSFSEGLAAVSKNNKFGFINKEGKEIIPMQYDYAYSFSEGLAAVNKGGEWYSDMMIGGRFGFIDTVGNLVIPHQYGRIIESFHNGKAIVTQNASGPFTIDREGNKIE